MRQKSISLLQGSAYYGILHREILEKRINNELFHKYQSPFDPEKLHEMVEKSILLCKRGQTGSTTLFLNLKLHRSATLSIREIPY